MTRMLALALAWGCTQPDAPPPAQYDCTPTSTDHPRAEAFQALVDAGLAAGSPAISAAVIDTDGVWLSAGGSADLGQDIDVDTCHRFYVASVTKMFASATALRLAEDGVWSLDDPARDYLPAEVVDKIANLDRDTPGGGATLAQLLQHTSGIPDYLTIDYFLAAFNGQLTGDAAADELRWAYGRDPWFDPGTDLAYSNANYLLLSLAMEQATGEAAYDTVRHHVLDPLQLTATDGRSDASRAIVRGYGDLHGNGRLMDHTELTEGVMLGAGKLDGGLVSTPHDVAQFLRAVAQGELLEEPSQTELTSFYDYEPGEDDGPEDGYSLGLARLDTPYGVAWGHYGGVYPFQSAAFHFPDHDVTAVVFASGFTSDVSDWINGAALFDPALP